MIFLFLFFNLLIHFLSFTEGDIYFVYLILLSFLFFFVKNQDSLTFEEEILENSKIYFFLELELLTQKLEVKKSFFSFLTLLSFLKKGIKDNFLFLVKRTTLQFFSQETLLLRKSFFEFFEKKKENEKRELLSGMNGLYLTVRRRDL